MPLKRDKSLIPLSHDHHHGLARVFEIRQALRGGNDLAAQAEITLRFWESDLAPHFRAEEEVLFPSFEKFAGDGHTRKLIEEHRELERRVDRLRRGDDVAGALRAVADLLEPHIRFEERQLFPVFQDLAPAAERAAVGAGLRRVLQRPDDTPAVCDKPRR